MKFFWVSLFLLGWGCSASVAFADCHLNRPLLIKTSDPRAGVTLKDVTFDQEVQTAEIDPKENGSYIVRLFRILNYLSPNANSPTEGVGVSIELPGDRIPIGFLGIYSPGFNGSVDTSMDGGGTRLFETTEYSAELGGKAGNSVKVVLQGDTLTELEIGLPVAKLDQGVFEESGRVQKLCVLSGQLVP